MVAVPDWDKEVMMKKAHRIIVLINVAAYLIVVWFIPNIVRWHLGSPYKPSEYPLVVWIRFLDVMTLVAILCELRWRTPFPLKEGQFWKRVILLALLGGTVPGWLITSHFPNPTIWKWAVISLVLAAFGGIQVSLIGTLGTANYLPSSRAPKT